jgi:redox-sensitive bicupin YhaK (pirin superfamily)
MVKLKLAKNKHDNVKDSTLILLTRGEDLTVKAKSDTKFLVISGKAN